MRSNNSNGSRVARARGFTGLWTVLVMGLVASATMARPAEVHRAFVANSDSKDVLVIDRDTNKPIPVGHSPREVAVIPDGKHLYVANVGDNTVSVIDTDKNMVVGLWLNGVAVKPSGKKAQSPRIIHVRWACCSTNGQCVRLC
jgi:YVTN family beta-propeller protein